jgi:hypothetical protein
MDISRLKKKDERVLPDKVLRIVSARLLLHVTTSLQKPDGPQDEMKDRLQKFRG